MRVTRFLILSVFSILTTVHRGHGQTEVNSNFMCDEPYCVEALLNNPCPIKRNCSTQGYRTYMTPERCNCCKDVFCIEYIGEDKTCSIYPRPADINLCGPRLTCDTNLPDPQCRPITTTACMRERNSYDEQYDTGKLGTAQFKPECDDVGRYFQRQCLPGSVCFCTNPEGQRIFGIGLPTELMNCRCAKDIYQLTSVVEFGGKLPRCLPNGDYDPMQCVGRDCWCHSKPQTRVRLNELEKLDCYDESIHKTSPSMYIRPCEYELAELEIAKLKAANEATVLLAPNIPRCDFDGFYSPLQSRNDKFICVDSQGQQIEDYEIDKKSPVVDKVDCHCARIRKLMEKSVNGRPTCCKNGNFRKWQCSGSLCYCVDRDGKQVVTGPEPYEVRKEELSSLPCYGDDSDDCVY